MLSIAFGLTAALQLQLQLFVVLIEPTLLDQQLQDLSVGNLLLGFEVFMSRVCDRDVGSHQLVLRLEDHLDSLVLGE